MNLLKILVSGALLTGATGCIGGGGQALDENTVNSAITTVATTVFSKLPQSASAPSLPAELGGISLSSKPIQSRAAACETITPSVLVDADNDSIAAQKKYEFDCSNFTFGDSTFTRKGSITVTDKDDTVAGLLGGLEVEFNVTSFRLEGADGGVFDYTFLGSWDYGQEGSSLVSSSEFKGRILAESAGYDYKIDYEYGYNWDYKMTPANSSQFFNAGTVEFSGEFTLDGEFYVEDHSNNKQTYKGLWVIGYQSDNLTYDQSCSKWYKTGGIKITDGSSAVYEIRFNCDSAKFYVNGSESDLYTP